MKYTIEFCDREYNARAAIPGHASIFASWAERAAATRRLRACLQNLRFGDSAAETLDLFTVRDDGAPLFVFIHGGYWRSLDKADFSWLATPFVERGIAVALINYGLAPRTPMEDIVRQTLRALAWLYRNADLNGVDRERIFVGGHSAGGHLTAMAMAALWPAFATDLPPDLVKGGLAVSGLFDLQPLLFAPFVNVDLQLDARRADRLSPALMPAATKAPLITAVGALESSEFRRQSELLGAAWKANVVRHLKVPGANHLSVCDELGNADSALFGAALGLIAGRART
jgi:arylformamidase